MFTPLPDELLDSSHELTNGEMDRIDNTIVACNAVINACGSSDQDVLAYHRAYIKRVIDRLERSIAMSKRFNRRHLRLL